LSTAGSTEKQAGVRSIENLKLKIGNFKLDALQIHTPHPLACHLPYAAFKYRAKCALTRLSISSLRMWPEPGSM